MLARLKGFSLALLLGWTMPALAGLDAVTNQEAASGLKSALEQGSSAAVDLLGKTDGFLGNKAVKIPLPSSLKKYEKLMRGVGMGKYADELILTMNRAAEQAVPEAKKLFVDAIKKMSLKDAKGILSGGQTSGTEYFKRTTSPQLREKFLPIVKSATRQGAACRNLQRVRAEGSAVRAGEQGKRQPRRVRHAEGARWPVLHGGRGREEDPPESAPGGQRHRQEGVWLNEVSRLAIQPQGRTT
jgi:hypothetical protein